MDALVFWVLCAAFFLMLWVIAWGVIRIAIALKHMAGLSGPSIPFFPSIRPIDDSTGVDPNTGKPPDPDNPSADQSEGERDGDDR